MATAMDSTDLDREEQFARIRQMIAETDARQAERLKFESEARQAMPRLVLTAMTATAALMGAGAALASLIAG